MLREAPMTRYFCWDECEIEEGCQIDAPAGFPDKAAERFCWWDHHNGRTERTVVVRSPDGIERVFVVTLRAEPSYTAKEKT